MPCCSSSLCDNTESSTNVVEEIGDGVELIASAGIGAKDGEVKKDDEGNHWDDVDGIAEKCGGVIAGEGEGARLGARRWSGEQVQDLFAADLGNHEEKD